MKNEQKATQPLGDVAQSPVDQSAGDQTEVPQPRPFSTRDYVYESIKRSSIEDHAGRNTGHEMNAGERELTLKALVASIHAELETLKAEAYAQDDMAALECLHSIAYESTRQLFLLTQYSPDLVSRVAEHETVWPILYSNAAVAKKAAANVIDVIKLGTKSTGALDPSNALSETSDARIWIAGIASLMDSIRAEARQQTSSDKEEVLAFLKEQGLSAPPGAVEQAHFDDLKSIATAPDEVARLSFLLKLEDPFKNPGTLENLIAGSKRLPPLGPEEGVVDAWMQVIKQLLMDVYEGHPEESPIRRMGWFQAEPTKDLYPEGTPIFESNLRTGIWVRLKSTLKSIAKPKDGA